MGIVVEGKNWPVNYKM